MKLQETKDRKALKAATEKGREKLPRSDALTAFFPEATTEARARESLEVVPEGLRFCKTEGSVETFSDRVGRQQTLTKGTPGTAVRPEGRGSRRGARSKTSLAAHVFFWRQI